MAQKIKLGLIGLGHLGLKHFRIYTEQLQEKVEIIGLCDVDPVRFQALPLASGIPSFTDYKELLLQQPDLTAVDICTPTVFHYEIGEYFLKNKKHVFIEKPITSSLEEADRLVEAASKNGCKLQVGHVERFNSAFQAIRPIAQDPLFIECHRLNQFPNRSLDIGVVADLMIHDIDIILGLINSPLKDIQAIGVNVLTDKEDIANARLTFKNQAVCNLTASRVSDEVTRKIRIFLPETYISLDYVKQEAFLYKKNGGLISKNSLPIEKEEPLRKELESFLNCLLNDTPPVVSGQDGRQALQLALAISQKIWKKNDTSL